MGNCLPKANHHHHHHHRRHNGISSSTASSQVAEKSTRQRGGNVSPSSQPLPLSKRPSQSRVYLSESDGASHAVNELNSQGRSARPETSRPGKEGDAATTDSREGQTPPPLSLVRGTRVAQQAPERQHQKLENDQCLCVNPPPRGAAQSPPGKHHEGARDSPELEYLREEDFLQTLQSPQRSNPVSSYMSPSRGRLSRFISQDSVSEGYNGSVNTTAVPSPTYVRYPSDRGYGNAAGGYAESEPEYLDERDLPRRVQRSANHRGSSSGGGSQHSLTQSPNVQNRIHTGDYYSNYRRRMIKARQQRARHGSDVDSGPLDDQGKAAVTPPATQQPVGVIHTLPPGLTTSPPASTLGHPPAMAAAARVVGREHSGNVVEIRLRPRLLQGGVSPSPPPASESHTCNADRNCEGRTGTDTLWRPPRRAAPPRLPPRLQSTSNNSMTGKGGQTSTPAGGNDRKSLERAQMSPGEQGESPVIRPMTATTPAAECKVTQSAMGNAAVGPAARTSGSGWNGVDADRMEAETKQEGLVRQCQEEGEEVLDDDDDAEEHPAAQPEFEFDINQSFRHSATASDTGEDGLNLNDDLLSYYGDDNDDSVEELLMQQQFAAMGYAPNKTNNDVCYQDDQHHVDPLLLAMRAGRADEASMKLARRQQDAHSKDSDADSDFAVDGATASASMARACAASLLASFPGTGKCHTYDVDDFARPLASLSGESYVYGEDVVAALVVREARAAARRDHQNHRVSQLILRNPVDTTEKIAQEKQQQQQLPPPQSPHEELSVTVTEPEAAPPGPCDSRPSPKRVPSTASIESAATERHQPIRGVGGDLRSIAPPPTDVQHERTASVPSSERTTVHVARASPSSVPTRPSSQVLSRTEAVVALPPGRQPQQRRGGGNGDGSDAPQSPSQPPRNAPRRTAKVQLSAASSGLPSAKAAAASARRGGVSSPKGTSKASNPTRGGRKNSKRTSPKPNDGLKRNVRGGGDSYRSSAAYRNGGGLYFLSTYDGGDRKGEYDGDAGGGDGGGGDYFGGVI